MTTNPAERITEARIEADPNVPVIHIVRDFRAAPAQVVRAHTDPELFARWVGPDALSTRIDGWDARTGGSYSYTSLDGQGGEYNFRGCFHTIQDDRIVQTFSFAGFPDVVALETLLLTDLGDGWTRLRGSSLWESFEARDGMLSSGMEVGVNEGYRSLQALFSDA